MVLTGGSCRSMKKDTGLFLIILLAIIIGMLMVLWFVKTFYLDDATQQLKADLTPANIVSNLFKLTF